jgi:Holliday junction resolvase-like predicted endonuclease
MPESIYSISTEPLVSKLAQGLKIERNAESWFLTHRPAQLISRNYRGRVGEIDLIFEEDTKRVGEKELVFVEVRARGPRSLQSGVESVDGFKRRKLTRIIQKFLMSYRGPGTTLRVDILDWDGTRFHHFENIRML